jgi:transcriptional regulator with XRE-family HTH domain
MSLKKSHYAVTYSDHMEAHSDAGDFLRTRRDRVTPQAAGLVAGGRRKVPGLRREEVALLAGVSPDYYARMERGDLASVSEEVLESVADALQLDAAERAHLKNLARAARIGSDGPGHDHPRIRSTLHRFLDNVAQTPIWIRSRTMTVVSYNPLGEAVLAPVLAAPKMDSNLAKFMFLHPRAADYYIDWSDDADNMVATLRAHAGESSQDEELSRMIDELRTRSVEFEQRWSAHNVRFHHSGTKRLYHPVVGELEFVYEPFTFPDNPDLLMFALIAKEPDGPTERRLESLRETLVTPPDVGR